MDELLKFSVVGGIAFVVDVALFNALRFEGDIWSGPLSHKPITAKVISVSVATVVTYVGNRRWTWADRARRGVDEVSPAPSWRSRCCVCARAAWRARCSASMAPTRTRR